MRAKGSLERTIMLGQVAGHRRQGKPRLRWLGSIKEATGLCLEALKETVQDRKKWHMLVEEKSQRGTHKCEMHIGEGNGKPLLINTPGLGNPSHDHQESNQT
jgi:hypothetical protein